jgi:hypothetical protein
MTLYGIKMDVGTLKADEHLFKVSQGQIKIGSDNVNVLRGFHMVG